MVTLKDRNEENVIIFWEYSMDEELNRLYPFEQYSLEEFLNKYHQQNRPDSDSYGKCIYFKDEYVGDVWCYAIDKIRGEAFLSILIFKEKLWGKGIGQKALELFMSAVWTKLGIHTMKLYTYESNKRAVNCFRKSGFTIDKRFNENGVWSYLMVR